MRISDDIAPKKKANPFLVEKDLEVVDIKPEKVHYHTAEKRVEEKKEERKGKKPAEEIDSVKEEIKEKNEEDSQKEDIEAEKPRSSKADLTDNFFRSSTGKVEEKEGILWKSISGKVLWLIFIAIIAGLAWFLYRNFNTVKEEFSKSSATSKETTVTPNQDYTSEAKKPVDNTSTTPASTSSAPTPSVPATTDIDKAAIKLKLLNGNGITGSAADVQAQLQTAGFTVPKPTNAKVFTYAQTMIYYKTGKETEANLVKAALTGREVVIELNDSLVGTSDLLVVVGKK